MKKRLDCFKEYDIRGEIGKNFDDEICYLIGRAFAQVLNTRKVVVGYDARESSKPFSDSLIRGLNDQGSDVLELGLCGTEEMYCATNIFQADGGIQITGSHNPINYNGLKMVKAGSRPLDKKSEFCAIKNLLKGTFKSKKETGSIYHYNENAKSSYIDKICELIGNTKFRPLKVVINSGSGAAGPIVDRILSRLNLEKKYFNIVRLFHDPDGRFPGGIPNPLLLENQEVTQTAVIRENADLGIAFDGDFDRCFFFDENGEFVKGEYIVGLLAQFFLEKERGAKIIHDARIIWNIENIVQQYGGNSLLSRTGHVFFKQSMRENNAIYGGELSAHHYFRDFFNCDSGMLPWLLVCGMMSSTNKPLSKLIDKQRVKFPSSGEYNFRVHEPTEVITRIIENYSAQSKVVTNIDGVSVWTDNWRFNLRKSNTEPLIRLNIEAKNDIMLVDQKLKEISSLITGE